MASAATPAAPVSVVAASGLPVPDQAGVAFGRGLSIPAINNDGRIVFYGAGGSGYHFFEGTSRQDLATVIQNFPPPTGAGPLGFEATTPILTDSGSFASRYMLIGQPGQSLVYRGPGGAAPTYAVVEPNAFENLNPAIRSVALNDAGTALLLRPGTVSSPAATSILSYTPAGGVGTFVSAGQPAPGSPGLTMRTFSAPLLDDAGDALFRATLSDASGAPAGSGVYLGRSASGLELVARTGQAAPGVGAGATFVDPGILSVDSLGRALFMTSLSPDPSNPNYTGPAIYRYTPGAGLELVVRNAQPLPVAGDIVRSFTGPPVMISGGRVVFRDFPRLYIGTSAADFKVIAGQGVPAPPELTAGTAYSLYSPQVIANNAGQVVFVGQISGASAANDLAVFAWDSSAGLHMLLREGDSIEVAPGDVRTILAGDIPHNSSSNPAFLMGAGFPEGGLERALNDKGELAMLVYLTSPDSSQPYSSAVITVQVPEPGTLAWVGAVVCLTLAPRRARR